MKIKGEEQSLFLPGYESLEFPIITKLFHHANQVISQLPKHDDKAIYENRVVIAAYHYFVNEHTFYVEKGTCAVSCEQCRIHHCLWNGKVYLISVLVGAYNKKHKNYNRIDKISLCHAENR